LIWTQYLSLNFWSGGYLRNRTLSSQYKRYIDSNHKEHLIDSVGFKSIWNNV
jgi:hypothetical protein